MKQPASPGSPEQWTRDEPTPERRRLLKAAAAAAPLIATLPSGAARAMSSTSQCIIADRTKSQTDQTVAGAVDFLHYDGFVRDYGYRYVYKNGNDFLTIYRIGGGTPSGDYYFGTTGSLADGTPYKIGEVFNPTGDDRFADRDWTIASGPTQVLLLKLYRAESDTGDPYENPTCANDCTPDTTDTNSACIFPVSQIGSPDQPGDNPGNNTGLTTSCLTSVHPSQTGESCPM